MKRIVFFALSLLSTCVHAATKTPAEKTSLPVPYESAFQQSMSDPNVMIYHADLSYRKGAYDEALRWMLEAARTGHAGAIQNAKFMIKNHQGAFANRETVISFLLEIAKDAHGESPDAFAQMYLADYYRGDRCVWFSADDADKCGSQSSESPAVSEDLIKSYFYYEMAANRGDARARYTVGMMNLLGVGVPRNVPLAIEWLRPLAENGNSKIAFLIGLVYQHGYWMSMDRVHANSWFEKATLGGTPGAALFLAKNAESGQREGDAESRKLYAEKMYKELLSNLRASDTDRAEATYRLGLLAAAKSLYGDDDGVRKLMYQSAGYAEKSPNEHSAQALVWLGSKTEMTDMSRAVGLYKKAWALIEKLPLSVQQRNTSILERLSMAYSKGQSGNLARDERTSSEYMSLRRQILAKGEIAPVKDREFEGFTAFHYPG